MFTAYAQSGEKPADHATKMTKKENLKWISTFKPDEVGWDADLKSLSGEQKGWDSEIF